MSENEEGLVWIDEDGNKLQITKSHADLLRELKLGNKLKIALILALAVLGIMIMLTLFWELPTRACSLLI